MEYETVAIRDGFGVPLKWVAGVDTGNKVFTGCGPTEDAALIDAMEKASRECPEALFELGVLLGQRGGRPSPGRPPHAR